MSFWDHLGGFFQHPVQSIGQGLGMENKFQATGAPINNPFGTDQSGQDLVKSSMSTSGGILGQQTSLADIFAGRMSSAASDPRYAELYGMAMDQAQGRGPNPAQEQYKQNLDTATQQQAGTVASVRGLNPALAARLAAQGGASMRQGAAGQAATLQAQQQLAGQQQAAGVLGQQNQVGQGWGALAAGAYGNAGQQGLTQQQIIQAAIANQNAQRVGMQSNINNVNAGVAAQNAATNAQLGAGLIQGGASAIAAMFGAKGGRVTPRGFARAPHYDFGGDVGGGVDMSGGAPPDAGGADAGGGGGAGGGASGGGGSDLKKTLDKYMHPIESTLRAAGDAGIAAFRNAKTGAEYAPYVLTPGQFAEGGPVAREPLQWNARARLMAQPPQAQQYTPQMMASHGPPPAPPNVSAQAAAVARQVAESLSRVDPKSAAVVYADLTGIPTDFSPEDTRRAYHMLALHNAALASQPAAGGPLSQPVQWNPRSRMMASPAMRGRVSPPPADGTVPLAETFARGGRARPFKRDGKVPGKADVRGDSLRNDKVPAMLSPGEIVVPRSVTTAPDAPRKAANFVAHLVSRKRGARRAS